MSPQGLIQFVIYFTMLLALLRPLGRALGRAYRGEPGWLQRLCGPLERGLCRLMAVPAGPGPLPAAAEMSWSEYVLSLLAFQGAGVVAALLLQRFSAQVPSEAGPALLRAGSVLRSFVAAAGGLALVLALGHGLRRPRRQTVGNCWVDLIRGTLYLLLPLALFLLLLLAFKGLVQPLAQRLAAMLTSLPPG